MAPGSKSKYAARLRDPVPAQQNSCERMAPRLPAGFPLGVNGGSGLSRAGAFGISWFHKGTDGTALFLSICVLGAR